MVVRVGLDSIFDLSLVIENFTIIFLFSHIVLGFFTAYFLRGLIVVRRLLTFALSFATVFFHHFSISILIVFLGRGATHFLAGITIR